MKQDDTSGPDDFKKMKNAAIGLATFGAALMAGQVAVKFDPSKDLSLASFSASIEMSRASASCSSNGKGSGCVC